MGVKSLTGYLGRQSHLADIVILPQRQIPAPPPTPFIVDGLAWLYQIGMTDTLRGGNYHQLRLILRAYIEYWRACGLAPEVVWDGPFEASKTATVIQRSEQSLQKALRYMRMSDTERAAPGAAASASRLPLLSMGAAIDELAQLGVPTYFAEGEADSPTADWAEQRNGYMASVDSDYFIYPSNCLGYVPLNKIEYGANRNAAPSNAFNRAELYFPVFQYKKTATLLGFPPSYLPVFAALVGNDHFSAPEVHLPRGPATHYKSFPGYVSKEDISRIARALGQIPPNLDYNAAFRTVLPKLLGPSSPLTPTLSESLLESARSYDLKPLGSHVPGFPLTPRATDTPTQAGCRALYSYAYHTGRINIAICSILKHRSFAPGGSLENPDYQSPSIYIGRPLRLWIYAILNDTIGFDSAVSIEEIVRRGENLRPEAILIPHLNDMLTRVGVIESSFSIPIVLSPPKIRLSVYTTALSWRFAPPTGHLLAFFPLVLALRHIQAETKRPWGEEELAAAILTAVLCHAPDLMPDTRALTRPTAVPNKTHIQRSVELTQALFYINMLADVLLLTGGAADTSFEEGTLLPHPHTLFNGALLHMLFGTGAATSVAQGGPPVVKQVFDEVWALLTTGWD